LPNFSYKDTIAIDHINHMVQFDVITLFPGIFDSPLQESIVKRAQQKNLIRINVHNLRDYTLDKHHTADDCPYGGGAGMVMKVEPIVRAIEDIKVYDETAHTILLTPQGGLFSQKVAQRLSTCSQIIMVCGRYEGVDERAYSFADEELSIGDYILTGGETAALVIIDAVSRLVPGVVGDRASVTEDTFSNWLLKYPQYTRPESFRDITVPEVLVSGDHGKIREWRKIEALKKTLKRRPDLLAKAALSDEDIKLLHTIQESSKRS